MGASPQAPTRSVIANHDVRIEVLAQGDGRGRVIVLLPSLGRGASDFEPIAERLAGAGYRVLRPQPRGIGQSRGPLTGIDLHDYAADVAAVIAHEGQGACFRRGSRLRQPGGAHAGDRSSRSGARGRARGCKYRQGAEPAAGRARRSATAPTRRCQKAERIEALQFAFFAPGNDPRGWLEGWHPEVLQAQRIAGDRTSREEDFAAGRAPILYLQPDHDPLAHVEDARAYKERFAERVTVVVIARSSHAVIAEQPDAVSAALISYARELWPDESAKSRRRRRPLGTARDGLSPFVAVSALPAPASSPEADSGGLHQKTSVAARQAQVTCPAT